MSRSEVSAGTQPESTKDRIFAAARELFETQGFEVSMGEIGRSAGISRQAVYLHFANRADLLRQLTTWIEEQAGLGSLLKPVYRAPTGIHALQALLEAQAIFEPQIHALAQAVERIGSGDPAVQAISTDRMRRRLTAMTAIVERIRADGRLKPDWDVDRAAAFVWSTTAPTAYHLMVVELGWTPQRWAAETYRLLHDAFIVAD